MEDRPRVFLDTSVLFSAVYSATGGARQILKLGEARAVSLWVGPWTLQEAEAVIERKVPRSKAYFALLLDQAGVQVGTEASEQDVAKALAVVAYRPDARVLAEALAAGVDYLVTFDREHLLTNPETQVLPFLLGTAGDFLEWYRQRLIDAEG
ncbi:MAG: PIN domain-containing protein [Anaerolineae bacterium]